MILLLELILKIKYQQYLKEKSVESNFEKQRPHLLYKFPKNVENQIKCFLRGCKFTCFTGTATEIDETLRNTQN